MTPLSTSPVPAVASRASPSRRPATAPSGSATTVVGPLSSTIAPVRAASERAARGGRARAAPPVRRSYSPSWGVRTVQRRPRAEQLGGIAPRAVRPSPSTTSGRSTRREPGTAPRRRRRRCAETGPTTSAREPVGAVEHVVGPALGRERQADGLGGPRPGRRRRPAMPSRTYPAPARWAAAGGEVRGAGHARRAGHHPARRRATCGLSRAAGRQPAGHVVAPRPAAARAPATSRPMSATHDLAGEAPARLEHQARLERGEGDGAPRPATPGRGLAGAARRPRRGCRPPAPARPRRRAASVLAVGSRCRRRRRSPGRRGGRLGRGVAGVDHRRPATPRRRSRTRRGPAVVAVVALAGDDHHPPAVGPPSRRARARATAAPARSMSTSTGSGAAASIGGHLVGRDDRDHPRQRRPAMALGQRGGCGSW